MKVIEKIEESMLFRAVGTPILKNYLDIDCEPGDLFVTMYQDFPNSWVVMCLTDGKYWSFPNNLARVLEEGFQIEKELKLTRKEYERII